MCRSSTIHGGREKKESVCRPIRRQWYCSYCVRGCGWVINVLCCLAFRSQRVQQVYWSFRDLNAGSHSSTVMLYCKIMGELSCCDRGWRCGWVKTLLRLRFCAVSVVGGTARLLFKVHVKVAYGKQHIGAPLCRSQAETLNLERRAACVFSLAAIGHWPSVHISAPFWMKILKRIAIRASSYPTILIPTVMRWWAPSEAFIFV